MKLTKLLLFFIGLFFSAFSHLHSQIIHVDEDFNSGSLPTGWTNSAISGTDRWQFGNDGSDFEAGNNNIDSSNMAYFDDDLLAGTALNNTAQLSTSSFNNSANALTFLSFDFNFKSFFTLNDSFYVEVFDGVNWNTVFSVKTDDCGSYVGGVNPSACQSTGFPKAFIDISSYANQNCIVRFIYHDDDDWAWYAAIDNILIYSPEPYDIGVSSIDFPFEGVCSLSDRETINCTVTNFSPDTILSFQIQTSVDSGNQIILDTVNALILPYGSLNYTFSKSIDLSLLKSYDLVVSTSSGLDPNPLNDSSHFILSNRSFKTLPYFEGFESSNHEWTVSGTNPSWKRGFPLKKVISRPASGSNAFVTKLDSNSTYNSNELSYLTSPCIELDSSIEKYLLSFYLIFNTEQVNDEFWLEYTTDGGLNWSKLQKSSPKLRWYNVDSKDVWGGNTRYWATYRMTFDKPIGSSEIKFRFVFKSDRLNEREGVGIDNFSVRPVNPTDLIIGEVISPRYSTDNLCGLSSNQEVKIEFLNIGGSPIDSAKLSYQIDTKFPFREWLNDTIFSDSSYTFTFVNKGDFSSPTVIQLSLFLEYYNGINFTYDTLIRFIDNSYFSYKRAPYFENFDLIFKPVGGTIFGYNEDVLNPLWSRGPILSPEAVYLWRVGRDSALHNPNPATGPLSDHTGNGGNYLFTAKLGFLYSSNNETSITSPCISIQSPNAELSFWYHRFGSNFNASLNNQYVNNLYVDVHKNGQWDIGVDTILGSTQNKASDPYLQRKVQLSAYSNEFIKIRFRATSNYAYPESAIDDFHVYDSSIVTGIESKTLEEKAFSLYPNPNTGEFTLSTKKEMLGSEFEVYNMSGQLVFNGILSNQKMKLNLSDYGKGIYIIRLPRNNSAERVVVH